MDRALEIIWMDRLELSFDWRELGAHVSGRFGASAQPPALMSAGGRSTKSPAPFLEPGPGPVLKRLELGGVAAEPSCSGIRTKRCRTILSGIG
jgi:hypothetical protein